MPTAWPEAKAPGAIRVPWDLPGLGFDANLERIQARTLRSLVLDHERAPVHA